MPAREDSKLFYGSEGTCSCLISEANQGQAQLVHGWKNTSIDVLGCSHSSRAWLHVYVCSLEHSYTGTELLVH